MCSNVLTSNCSSYELYLFSSPVQGQPVGFDHPVVMEWSKAYDSVIKFKDNLIDLLSETSGPMAAMADDLRTLELHRLDRSGDVQGQITEMRFSLALMLHQIEQTLQDTLSQAMDTEDFVETGLSLSLSLSLSPFSLSPSLSFSLSLSPFLSLSPLSLSLSLPLPSCN